jgi:PqqD family protein of HPr-rel-A system
LLGLVADSADDILMTPLDGLTALYHRKSGITHVVAEPVPQILEVLGHNPLSETALFDALVAQYDVPATTEMRAALASRLDELKEVGLLASL